jgi:hypothetical protein
VSGFHIQPVETGGVATLVMDSSIASNNRVTIWNNSIQPLFAVDDKDAVSYGTIEGTNKSGFARKRMNDYTSWFVSIAPADVSVWRYILQQSGAHLYDTAGDVLYAGNGVLTIHTARGGNRKIELKNGKRISIDLKPNSTTVLNENTGAVIDR